MVIDESGNIGIGTNNPTTGFGRNVEISGTGGGSLTVTDVNGARFLIGATTPNGLYFRDELAGSGTYRNDD